MLATFGAWLVKKFGKQEADPAGHYAFSLDPELVDFAERVVRQVAADLPGASGENKRHRAFALLRRKKPGASSRDTSKALELALDRVA